MVGSQQLPHVFEENHEVIEYQDGKRYIHEGRSYDGYGLDK